jgi:hypothetical protein
LLVPPEVYFESHPEYFAYQSGIRIPDGQLCLTNPDVLKITVEELRQKMEARPDARYWSVSQNDTYSNCQCEACQTIDQHEGSPSGSLLHFVNQVAAEFPDKTISTLAYQYTRSAPKTIQPADNVNIVLCTIECNRSESIATDSRSRDFRRDMKEWDKICDNILVWDYVVQFRSLVSPFPNFHVLQPNIRFFLKHNAYAMFQQGNGSPGGEFAELRAYLISKLLWNPKANVDRLMDDFLQGYYGPASEFIRSYIDRMTYALKKSGERLDIYGTPISPRNGYLALHLIDEYNVLFDKAEKSVAQYPHYLERVQIARLPLMYAILEQAKQYGTQERGFYRKREDGTWAVRPEMRELLNRFVIGCQKGGIQRLEEHGTSPAFYREAMERLFNKSMQNHLALFKPVTLTTQASQKYHEGDESALTNGLKGMEDYHCHWLGFEGEDMEAIIDLKEIQTVQHIKTDFLQTIISWVFLPQEVDYAISIDGIDFQPIAKINNPVPDTRDGHFIHPFEARFQPIQARYIRIKALNMKTCPDWHKGHGGLAWIFADEIEVW